MAAVNQNGLALEFASEELQNDRAIVIAAVQNNCIALQYASEELQNNLEIVVTVL